MLQLFDLFLAFVHIGLLSFGGGFAMIPLIRDTAMQHGWMTESAFVDAVALAGASPGPIAVNLAMVIGQKAAGTPGMIVAVLGSVLPSLMAIVLLSLVLYAFQDHRIVRSLFYGVRPVITALILYAAFSLFLGGSIVEGGGMTIIFTGVLLLAALLAMMRYKMHPLLIIVLCALAGVVIYA